LEAHHPAAGDTANVEFLWSVPASRVSDDPGSATGPLTSPPTNPPTNPPVHTGGSPESAADVRRREADAIAARIVRLLEDPTPRVLDRDGTARRVESKDAVLLFRSMSHVATYEAALRRHGLDYYLVG